jgi:hypothetical protein
MRLNMLDRFIKISRAPVWQLPLFVLPQGDSLRMINTSNLYITLIVVP